MNKYILIDGFAYNTHGYFVSCVVFFRAPKIRDHAGGGAGGALAPPHPPPPTFMLYKIKIKESSNKIAEEISLVLNGVKLQFNVSKSQRRHSRHKE